MINLKRNFISNNNESVKRENHVILPLTLDISPYVKDLNSQQLRDQCSYELVATINHMGDGKKDSRNGHYIADIRTGSNWHKFDDNTVKTMTEDEINKALLEKDGRWYSCVVFYKQVDKQNS